MRFGFELQCFEKTLFIFITMTTDKKNIIAIVGMPGAGKSEAAIFFKEKGWQIVRFGSVIDDGLKEEGKVWSAENNNYYREKIRKELGMAAVAIKVLPKIEKILTTEEKVILDGLYSWEEYIFLKKHFPALFLLCIYAKPTIRYNRLSQRKERSFTQEEARARDIHEIEATNKGGPIAIADYLVKNETTKEDLLHTLEAFYTSV